MSAQVTCHRTQARATFLGAWRLFADVGNGVGPLAVAAMTSVTAFGPAIVAMGGVAWLGAASMWWWIPKYGRPQP